MLRPAAIRTFACHPFAPLLLALLLLVSGSAFAQWTMLGRNDQFRIYIDPRSVERGGDFARTWQLVDFATAQWADERTVVGSLKNLIEYDCVQSRFRTLAMEAYSEQMGDGRMVAREQKNDAAWQGVEPGGSAEKMRRIACDGKAP